MIGASNDLGYDVVAVTGGSCAFVADVEGLSRTVENCAELSRWRADFAIDEQVDLVITTQATAGSIEGLRVTGKHENSTAAWVRANVEILRQLETHDVPVLFIGDVPTVGVNGSPCWYGVVGARCAVPRALVEERQAEGFKAEEAIVRSLQNAEYWSPMDELCDRDWCRSAEGGDAWYRDPEHLGVPGSAILKPRLLEVLSGILERGR